MVAHKAVCHILSNPFLIFIVMVQILLMLKVHTGFLCWRSFLWCTFLFWTLHVLQQLSPQLWVSACSRWLSAWLYSGNRRGWCFCSSGRAACCPFWQCNNQLLSPLSRPFSCSPDLCYNVSYEQVLLVYYQLKWTSPFQWYYCRLSFHMDLLEADCRPELHCRHNSHGCIVLNNILRISCSSVRHFLDLSWELIMALSLSTYSVLFCFLQGILNWQSMATKSHISGGIIYPRKSAPSGYEFTLNVPKEQIKKYVCKIKKNLLFKQYQIENA